MRARSLVLMVLLAASAVLAAADPQTAPADRTTFPWLEDFETGPFPPAGWDVYDWDENNYCWGDTQDQNHSPGGNTSAVHYRGTGANFDYEEGWLVSPAIQLPGPGYSLSFRAYNVDPNAWGQNIILVSSGSSDPEDGQFEEISYNPVPLAGDWYHYEIDLSAWAGLTIHVAFLYSGWEAHDWYLDDVQISQYDGIGGFPWCENFEF